MTIDKKAAKAAYKERKSVAGIYAVRCGASGQVWVGHTPTLGTIQNRIWFTLRQANHPDPGLQSAWAAHGPAGFAFEVLEADPRRVRRVRVRPSLANAGQGAAASPGVA